MILVLGILVPILPSVLGVYIAPDVVGGSPTGKDAPWVVSLQMEEDDFPYCGATLIHSQLHQFIPETKVAECSGWVVTAASCLLDVPASIATLGNFNWTDASDTAKTPLEVVSSFAHDTYDEGTHENDIGLLHVRFSKENVADDVPAATAYCDDIPVLKYKHDLDLNETAYPSIAATVYGWGLKLENGLLQKKLNNATIPLRSDRECLNLYRGTRLDLLFQLGSKGMNCAGGVGNSGACSYDTGGPLKCDYFKDGYLEATYLCGIASFGSGCALPAVFTDVSNYRGWIDDTIQKETIPSTSSGQHWQEF